MRRRLLLHLHWSSNLLPVGEEYREWHLILRSCFLPLQLQFWLSPLRRLSLQLQFWPFPLRRLSLQLRFWPFPLRRLSLQLRFWLSLRLLDEFFLRVLEGLLPQLA